MHGIVQCRKFSIYNVQCLYMYIFTLYTLLIFKHTLLSCIAYTVHVPCSGKRWRGKKLAEMQKFGILAGLNLEDLRLYISHAHSFDLLTRVRMEREADVAEFVLESVVRVYHTYQAIWEAAIR